MRHQATAAHGADASADHLPVALEGQATQEKEGRQNLGLLTDLYFG